MVVCPPLSPRTVNRTITPPSVPLWLFCALVAGLSPSAFGQQTLPPVRHVNVPNFTIPFEIAGTASAIREVELLVSRDRGRSWQFVDRQTIETGKFVFRADTDGEYCFAFRTITATGTPNPMTGHPELRVQVNTGNPVATLSSQPSLPSETGPIVPPRPERFRRANDSPQTQPSAQPHPQPQQMQVPGTEEPKVDAPAIDSEPLTQRPATNVEKVNMERTHVERPQIRAPRFPGFDPSAPEHNRNRDFVDDLLSEMSQFLDIEPVATKSTPNTFVAADRQIVADSANASLPQFPGISANAPAGSISDIFLNRDERPRIVVRWHTGHEQLWGGAQVDILRSNMQEEQPSPIAINLPNSGEYWWYLSPEDMKPFYITVRIRSVHSGISTDVTQKKIEIDPKLAVFQSQRP